MWLGTEFFALQDCPCLCGPHHGLFPFFLAHSLAVVFNNYPVITLQEMQDVCMLSIIKKGILTRHVMMCYVTLNHDTNL